MEGSVFSFWVSRLPSPPTVFWFHEGLPSRILWSGHLLVTCPMPLLRCRFSACRCCLLLLLLPSLPAVMPPLTLLLVVASRCLLAISASFRRRCLPPIQIRRLPACDCRCCCRRRCLLGIGIAVARKAMPRLTLLLHASIWCCLPAVACLQLCAVACLRACLQLSCLLACINLPACNCSPQR